MFYDFQNSGFIDVYQNYDLLGCSNLCKETDICTWFTYDTPGEICYLWTECKEHNNNKRYVTGEKECIYIEGNS